MYISFLMYELVGVPKSQTVFLKNFGKILWNLLGKIFEMKKVY